MKALLFSLVIALPLCLTSEEASPLAALTLADDARIAAMLSPSREALETLLSGELRYAHSSGTVDTKKDFIELLVSGKSRYLGYDHIERSFTFPAPEIALMSGRARVRAESAKGTLDAVLAYLAVWRFEEGKWCFLAWQSCRLPTD